jgi:hypothetical protein
MRGLGMMSYKENGENAGPPPEVARQQVDCVLSHPLFNQSKRFERFLRHVTELALSPEQKTVTERDLGIELFNRTSNYDTEADPIVRVTASEIRKRLARYYAEPEHLNEIRIELQKGSYVPEFHLPPPETAEAGSAIDPTRPIPVRVPAPPRRRLFAIATVGIAVLALAAVWAFRPKPAPLVLFWEPLTRAPGPVLVSYAHLSSENLHVAGVEAPRFAWSDPLTPSPIQLGVPWDRLAADLAFTHDLESTAGICAFLGGRQKQVVVKGAGTITLSGIRDVPAVFLGGFNNPWTARLLPNVRFTFAGDGDLRYIHDNARPAFRDWSFDAHLSPRAKDFILITRLIDSPNGQPALFAGGFSNWGTEAAAAFLTNPDRMRSALATAPADWPVRNLQIVLETTVLRAESGAPRVLAVHSW